MIRFAEHGGENERHRERGFEVWVGLWRDFILV